MAEKEKQNKEQKEQTQPAVEKIEDSEIPEEEPDKGKTGDLDEIDSEELDKISALLASKSKTTSRISSGSTYPDSPSAKGSQRIELKGAERRRLLSSSVLSKIAPLIAFVLIVGLIFTGGYYLGKRKDFFFSLGKSKTSGKNRAKEKAKAKKKKEQVIKVDKAAVKIDVLNGNGIKGESALISNQLKQSGWATLNATNADNHDYTQTVIRYKLGFEDAVKLISKEIVNSYPSVPKQDLGADSQADVVIILGKDKKVSASSIGIRILNGNGKKGSASEVANLLKSGGFEVRETKNADKFDYQESVVRYKPGQKDMARKIAKQIESKYKANLTEDASLDIDIVILLGLK